MEGNENDLRWGVLGAGSVAERFVASLAHVAGARLVAASLRSARKAEDFAAAHGLDPAHVYCDERLGQDGSAHEALLADPDVDAIYLALPHGEHHRWALSALRAHKAVLCEKPAMLSAAQMREVTQLAHEERTLFMEAMKSRFEPLYPQLKDLIASGAIGEVRRVEAFLCNDMGDRISSGRDYLSDATCGGALYDSGIYCASWLEDLLPWPLRLTALDTRTDTGVDCYVDAELGAGDATGRLVCATDAVEPGRSVRVIGTKGTLVVDQPHRPQSARLLVADEGPRVVNVPCQVDDFHGEIEHFCGLVREGKTESPVMPLEASVRCAQIIDSIRASFPAAEGRGPQAEPTEDTSSEPDTEKPAPPVADASTPDAAEPDAPEPWRNRVLCPCGMRDPSRP